MLVRKKNLDLCFCVDYRRLKYVTEKDCFLLPRIDDTLDTLAGARCFSTLDLKIEYLRMALHPDDKEKTEFSTGQGLWQFTVRTFGLCNVPSTFERLNESVPKGLTTMPVRSTWIMSSSSSAAHSRNSFTTCRRRSTDYQKPT
jgi:hypothetical protein